jgi:hypothetical protein
MYSLQLRLAECSVVSDELGEIPIPEAANEPCAHDRERENAADRSGKGARRRAPAVEVDDPRRSIICCAHERRDKCHRVRLVAEAEWVHVARDDEFVSLARKVGAQEIR